MALVGRSMRRIVESAQETGYLTGLPDFVSEHDSGYLPREKVALLCTGSQGEPRSALARIARNEHPQVALEPGDAVIFSSRIIPGNERTIGALQNNLSALGVEVLTAEDEPVHVSGHPARDELARMYQLVRPQIAIPVHGERRHLEAHAPWLPCQVPRGRIPTRPAALNVRRGWGLPDCQGGLQEVHSAWREKYSPVTGSAAASGATAAGEPRPLARKSSLAKRSMS